MFVLDISQDDLANRLLSLSANEPVFMLDSCEAEHPDARHVFAGIRPVEVIELTDEPIAVLAEFDRLLTGEKAVIFTFSYEFGEKMLGMPREDHSGEPDLFAVTFDSLFVADQRTGKTAVIGQNVDIDGFDRDSVPASEIGPTISFNSDMSRSQHRDAVLEIHERIRDGITYQTNLTRRLTAEVDANFSAADVFRRIRSQHPAPFAAFLQRPNSTVVSASPERFLRVDLDSRRIETSPIKGTRPRGSTPRKDEALRMELMASGKDIAENTMIVDLLRNDLGRVCEFGTVTVERLCEPEAHPTYFNLVSTISGRLRDSVSPSDVVRAMFPCGSITGAPKISTMRVIRDLEPSPRGLSMGAIGIYVPPGLGITGFIDMSVAIRTLTISSGKAVFNVGGGITIDSDPDSEFDETVTKSNALISSANGMESS